MKVSLLILPFLGISLGYLYAHIVFTGMLIPWRQLGQPGAEIVQILGIRDSRKILVMTKTGQAYAFEYPYLEKAAYPLNTLWEKETDLTTDIIPENRFAGADFISRPPSFPARQLFDFEYIYRVEGKGELKLALAPDGNLWLWDHKISGLTGLVYYFYPATGLITGLLLVFIAALYRKFVG